MTHSIICKPLIINTLYTFYVSYVPMCLVSNNFVLTLRIKKSKGKVFSQSMIYNKFLPKNAQLPPTFIIFAPPQYF